MKSILSKVMRHIAVDTPSPRLKQLPTIVAFVIAVVVVLSFPSTIPVTGWTVGAGVVVMLAASLFAARFSRIRRPTHWALLVPGFSFLAIGLFRAGTGGTTSLFAGLLILPVVWIAAENGRRWIFVAGLGTSAAIMLPYLLEWRLPGDANEWLRGLITPVAFALAATVVNEMSRQGRKRLASIRVLADERAALLENAIENEKRMKAADQLTRSVLDAVTEQSVIGTDLSGLIDVWNPGAMLMLGLAPHETQGYRHVFDFHLQAELEARSKELKYPPGATVLNPGFSALVESARRGQAETRQWTYVRDDDSEVAVQVAVTSRVDENGEPVGYIFVGTDVTRALEVARMKDEFIGLISHELRTPLSSILGYLELLRDDDVSPLTEEQLQYLGVADRNAHRLLRLVGDLLFTAQVESGKFPIRVGDVDLEAVVSAALESASPVATAAGVSLVGRLPESKQLLRGDEVRLGQACDNLLSNAIKFTPRGGSITVGLTFDATAATVSVRDTGIGIPADELDQLCSRFFRASTATRNAVQGVGLGLTITKAIVTAHDGELGIDSEEGVGTEFRMSLPLVSAGLPAAERVRQVVSSGNPFAD